jgi:hypothetical protein
MSDDRDNGGHYRKHPGQAVRHLVAVNLMRHLLLWIALLPATAAAGLITDSPKGVNEPRFYENLRAMLDQLSKSKDPIIRELYETAKNAPAAIHFRPMTGDRSTWNSDGTRARAHTEPDDKRPKREGRTQPTDATVFVPPNAVDPTNAHKSGVLVHELTHAIDLAYGRYNKTAAVRERRAVFIQNVWRARVEGPLRTSYHDRFPTLDYQEAARRGVINEYARYIFTRSDFPSPPAATSSEKGTKD